MKPQQTHQKRQPETGHPTKKTASQPTPEGLNLQRQDEVSLKDTPFQPDMDRHAAWLSKAHSEQRANFLLQLQQTYGNNYVQRLLGSKAIQAKLTVNQPGDVHEQEADRVADMVAREPLSVQKQEAVEDEEEVQMQAKNGTSLAPVNPLARAAEGEQDVLRSEGQPEAGQIQVSRLSRNGTGGDLAVPEPLADRILHTKGTGGPVPSDIQHTMNAHLGHDFSHVKVKSDAEAADLCQNLGARAFTQGADIWTGQGESVHDTKLMAHELTHVMQQGAAPQIVAGEKPSSQSRVQSQLERPPVGDVVQANGNGVPEPVKFPAITAITGDSKVKGARDEDWQAGKKDCLERFGWVTWDSKTKKCEVTGRKVGNEFGVAPGPAPADAPPVYMVGHYHTHPPLSEKMKKDQKEHRDKTGKEMFPIGPSGADKNFATNHNSPGVVEDFVTALRWPSWLTWDFKYGPTKRT